MERYQVPSKESPAVGPNDAELSQRGDAEITSEQEDGTFVTTKVKGSVAKPGVQAEAASGEQAPQTPAPPAPGPQFAKFTEEFAKNGALGEESYKELASLGLPREFVDQYISGFQATRDRQSQEIYATVGGEKAYQEIIDWAASALSPAEIEVYNATAEKGDSNQVKFAVAALKARYEASKGPAEPKLLSGSRPVSSGYRSVAEVQKAMSDARYKNDPAYREDVIRRIAASGNL